MLQITEERKRQGLSMSALAAKAGMHISSVSQIENGHLVPYPGQMKKLSKALEWDEPEENLFKEVGGR